MADCGSVKVWVGAVSRNVVKTAVELAAMGLPIGVIATPNEVSRDGGYLGWDVDAFFDDTDAVALRDKIGMPVGRDHGSRLASLVADVQQFDVIHVEDISYLEVLHEVPISRAVVYEVGNEERKYSYSADRLAAFLEHSIGFPVQYAVVQSGLRLHGGQSIGEFDARKLRWMCEVCHDVGVSAKMHNSDYLTTDMFKRHIDAGVDAINIGPELAAIEARVYLRANPGIAAAYSWDCEENMRYHFETGGVRVQLEDECGNEVREKISARIQEVVGCF